MAYAPSSTYFDQDSTIVGSFIESEFGNSFEFSINDEENSQYPIEDYPHKVWVTKPWRGDQGFRYGTVKKRVAYVVISDGIHWPVVETWRIKSRQDYIKVSTGNIGESL